MRRILPLVLISLASAAASRADTRWCTVTGRAAQDTVVYPPIAKAARVSGLVMGRLIFSPDGKVTDFEPVMGPPMLVASLKYQLSKWTPQTNATGVEPCQTLIVARFEFCEPQIPCEDNHSCSVETGVSYEPSILRIQAHSQIAWLCDPSGTIGYDHNPFRLIRIYFKRTVNKLFGKQ